jgi:hypothetical protein
MHRLCLISVNCLMEKSPIIKQKFHSLKNKVERWMQPRLHLRGKCEQSMEMRQCDVSVRQFIAIDMLLTFYTTTTINEWTVEQKTNIFSLIFRWQFLSAFCFHSRGGFCANDKATNTFTLIEIHYLIRLILICWFCYDKLKWNSQ